MILYLACLPGALLSRPNLGKDHPEINTLLFFRIDAWGPSWVQGKLFPGITPLASAGACCSSRWQAQSLLHINQVLWEVWWCCCSACPRNSSTPLQGCSELTLLWLPEGESAAGHAPVPASEMSKALWKFEGMTAVCTHLHSSFAQCWTLAPAAWGSHNFCLALKRMYSCLCFSVGNTPQLLERPSEVFGRTVDHLSHWGVFIYTQNNFPHTKIKVQVF